jgi:hypothetical protein
MTLSTDINCHGKANNLSYKVLTYQIDVFENIFKYVVNLDYESLPDYNKIRNSFIDISVN